MKKYAVLHLSTLMNQASQLCVRNKMAGSTFFWHTSTRKTQLFGTGLILFESCAAKEKQLYTILVGPDFGEDGGKTKIKSSSLYSAKVCRCFILKPFWWLHLIIELWFIQCRIQYMVVQTITTAATSCWYCTWRCLMHQARWQIVQNETRVICISRHLGEGYWCKSKVRTSTIVTDS